MAVIRCSTFMLNADMGWRSGDSILCRCPELPSERFYRSRSRHEAGETARTLHQARSPCQCRDRTSYAFLPPSSFGQRFGTVNSKPFLGPILPVSLRLQDTASLARDAIFLPLDCAALKARTPVSTALSKTTTLTSLSVSSAVIDLV